LSWLAFEGIRWVIENLGPDHILYPSLIDQPLVNEYLKQEWKTGDFSSYNKAKGIASFPNKFLFLVPLTYVEAIGDDLSEHINNEWLKLSSMVENQNKIQITGIFNGRLSSFSIRKTKMSFLNCWRKKATQSNIRH
ncbi:MAG: hypothetical protein JRD93_15540, partial [Deltaproteobacteria bacterium]|nr:hypothetical protein [Deltaproteobacteria bacterium]